MRYYGMLFREVASSGVQHIREGMRSDTESSGALDIFFVQEVLKIDNVTYNNLSLMINIILVLHILTSRVIGYTIWLSGSPVPHSRTLALILRGALDLVCSGVESEYEAFREFQVW